MIKPLKIGILSLALLAGTSSICSSPNQIDITKREMIRQAIEKGRYDSKFLDSLLEPSILTYRLTEPLGASQEFERKAREYGAIPYDPSETGDFSYVSIPDITNFISPIVKTEAILDTLFLYGKARFVLDRYGGDTLKTVQPADLLEIELHTYDINLVERQDLTEKYRLPIEYAVKEAIKECRVIGKLYQVPIYVQLPFSFDANIIIAERKKKIQ